MWFHYPTLPINTALELGATSQFLMGMSLITTLVYVLVWNNNIYVYIHICIWTMIHLHILVWEEIPIPFAH